MNGKDVKKMMKTRATTKSKGDVNMDYTTLEIGTKVEYVFFKNLEFVGTDDRHVLLKDKNGAVQPFYKELFNKYGKLQEDKV
jgi:hypothetical protein